MWFCGVAGCLWVWVLVLWVSGFMVCFLCLRCGFLCYCGGCLWWFYFFAGCCNIPWFSGLVPWLVEFVWCALNVFSDLVVIVVMFVGLNVGLGCCLIAVAAQISAF